MSLLMLAALVSATGVLFFFWHLKNLRASNGNEGGYISYFLLGFWSLLQMPLGAIFVAIALFTKTESATVWWVLMGLYAATLIVPAWGIGMHIYDLLTETWLPQSWATCYFRCKSCGHLHNMMQDYSCERCGADGLQAVFARSIFDWRNPFTWFDQWEFLPWSENYGFGRGGIWYGPNCPKDYTPGDYYEGELPEDEQAAS